MFQQPVYYPPQNHPKFSQHCHCLFSMILKPRYFHQLPLHLIHIFFLLRLIFHYLVLYLLIRLYNHQKKRLYRLLLFYRLTNLQLPILYCLYQFFHLQHFYNCHFYLLYSRLGLKNLLEQPIYLLNNLHIIYIFLDLLHTCHDE